MSPEAGAGELARSRHRSHTARVYVSCTPYGARRRRREPPAARARRRARVARGDQRHHRNGHLQDPRARRSPCRDAPGVARRVGARRRHRRVRSPHPRRTLSGHASRGWSLRVPPSRVRPAGRVHARVDAPHAAHPVGHRELRSPRRRVARVGLGDDTRPPTRDRDGRGNPRALRARERSRRALVGLGARGHHCREVRRRRRARPRRDSRHAHVHARARDGHAPDVSRRAHLDGRVRRARGRHVGVRRVGRPVVSRGRGEEP